MYTTATCRRILWLAALLVVSSHGFAPSSSSFSYSSRSPWRSSSTKARRIPISGSSIIYPSDNDVLKNERTPFLLLNHQSTSRLQTSSSSSSSSETATIYPRWKFWKRLGRRNNNNNNNNKRRMTRTMMMMNQSNQRPSSFKKMRWVPVMASFLAALFIPRLPAVAGGAMGGGIKAPVAPMERYVDLYFYLQITF